LGRDYCIKQWTIDRKAASTARKKEKKEKVLRLLRQFTFDSRPFRMFVVKNRIFVSLGDFTIHIFDIKTGLIGEGECTNSILNCPFREAGSLCDGAPEESDVCHFHLRSNILVLQ
jgi:hypothetical protein